MLAPLRLLPGFVGRTRRRVRWIGAGQCRAAGNALGANPIPIVVPCHRVLHSGGGLGGYGGGLNRKEFLLTLEGIGGKWSAR